VTLATARLYCREQFRVAGLKVMAFEYFEPTGDRQVFLRFSVVRPDGSEAFWYSLGSYEFTTGALRALKRIGKDERVFHLDQYATNFHATLAFYKFMPSYDQVRTRVVEALAREEAPSGQVEGM
jgi:hypothetical protein